jgi:hypothetical protein
MFINQGEINMKSKLVPAVGLVAVISADLKRKPVCPLKDCRRRYSASIIFLEKVVKFAGGN